VLAPYFPLYLEHRGLTAAQIGMVMAVAQGMRIFGPTAWGWLADHTTERVRILQFTSVAAALCFLPVLFPGGFGYVLLTMFAMHFFMTGQIPIAEAMTATQLRGDPRAATRYGRLRVWGSISFVIVVVATGVCLDWAGIALQPWLVLAFLVATAAAGQLVRDAPHAPHVQIVRGQLTHPPPSGRAVGALVRIRRSLWLGSIIRMTPSNPLVLAKERKLPSNSSMVDNFKKAKFHKVKCSQCKASLLIKASVQVCPICAGSLRFPEVLKEKQYIVRD